MLEAVSHMARGVGRLPRKALPLVALAALLVVVLALLSVDPSALRALPALLLPLLVVLRRYPGERILVVLSVARRTRRRVARSLMPARGRATCPLPRGGLLLACSLAVRPPPRATPAAS